MLTPYFLLLIKRAIVPYQATNIRIILMVLTLAK